MYKFIKMSNKILRGLQIKKLNHIFNVRPIIKNNNQQFSLNTYVKHHTFKYHLVFFNGLNKFSVNRFNNSRKDKNFLVLLATSALGLVLATCESNDSYNYKRFFRAAQYGNTTEIKRYAYFLRLNQIEL